MTDHLVCLACRTWSEQRIDVRTLERRGDVLACACGRRYPVIDGVPIVLPDGSAYLRDEATAVVERDLDPEVAALVVADGPDDAPYARLLEHLSIYLDAHWGDRATPPPDVVAGDGLGAAALVERLAALPRVGLAVELGASVGRGVAELARTADHVVGVDLQFAAVRRARRLLDGEPVAYARRIAGRHYAPARARAGDRAVPGARRTLVCGDVLDPPLAPGQFDRVVALNMLDSVRHPRQLLAVIDGLCTRGGEIVLASPYAWQSSVVAEDERIGGAEPAAGVAAAVRDLGCEIVEEAELGWTLRRDARSAVVYRTHYLRARKAA